MKRLFVLPLLASAILTSCDTSTEPILNNCSLENSMKLQTGNWWVYNRSDLDENNAVISGSERLDSVVVESTEVKLGKTSYLLVNYSTADGGITYTTDSTWMVVEGGQAYIFDNDLFPMLCQCVSKQWIKFADCSADTWTPLDTTRIDGIPSRLQLPNGEDTIVMSKVQFRFTMTGGKGAQSTITVAGQSVPVQEHNLDDTKRTEILEPEDMQLIGGGRKTRFTKKMRFLLAENIGIAHMEQTSEEAIQILNDGTEKRNTDVPLQPGMKRELLRWSVK